MDKMLARFGFALSVINLVAIVVLGLRTEKIQTEANRISNDVMEITEKNRNDEIELRSSEIVVGIYEAIYKNEYSDIIDDTRENKTIEDLKKLRLFVDEFEGLGSDMCRGIVNIGNIKTKLKKTIQDVCHNDQIYDLYAYQKNGLAMLCFEFANDSNFGQTLGWSNMNSCNFLGPDNLTSEKIEEMRAKATR